MSAGFVESSLHPASAEGRNEIYDSGHLDRGGWGTQRPTWKIHSGSACFYFIGPHYLHCCGKLNSIQQPASEFGVARQIAYQKNEELRGALKPYLH
jgi:hypothetical protein